MSSDVNDPVMTMMLKNVNKRLGTAQFKSTV